MRIIVAFPGTGKTYLKQLYGTRVRDLDSSSFRKEKGWEGHYVDIVEKIISENRYEILLCNMYTEIMKLMRLRGIGFEAVIPYAEDPEERRAVKEMMFGRFVLRDNSHIRNIDTWMYRMKKNYDTWTDPAEIRKYTDKIRYINLKDKYLADVV